MTSLVRPWSTAHLFFLDDVMDMTPQWKLNIKTAREHPSMDQQACRQQRLELEHSTRYPLTAHTTA